MTSFLLIFLLGVSTASVLEYGAPNNLDSYDSQADMIAEYFLLDFVNDMAIGRATRISRHFSEGFVFRGCDLDYDMKNTVALLIKKRTRISFEFKSAKFINLNDVQFTVGISGLGSPMEAEFVLREIQRTRMLVQGRIRQCA